MSDLRLVTEDAGGHAEPAHRRGCIPVLVALFLIVAIAVFAYVKGVDLIKDALADPVEDYAGDGQGSVVIEVRSGDTSTDIANTLAAAGVVKSAAAFIDAAKENPESTSIQVGFYQVNKQMSGQSALDLMLSADSRVSDTVTIPEGRRANEILALIVDQTDFSKSQVQRAFGDVAKLSLPSYAEGDPEGYLFPATYEVTPDMAAADLLRDMVDTFEERADDLDLVDKARDLGMSPHDVVIVASLVQAEASRVKDMALVASVTENRLGMGMRLQFDSTLHYAVDSRGVINPGSLLDIKSPYNTYKVTGLPPTAIDSPGEDALAAALEPADSDFLYFVTVNLKTGETKFAKSFGQHQRNVAEYTQYCQTSDAC